MSQLTAAHFFNGDYFFLTCSFLFFLHKLDNNLQEKVHLHYSSMRMKIFAYVNFCIGVASTKLYICYVTFAVEEQL